MNVLHHLGQAAALLLLLELLVFLLIFLGIAGGLAFGLHWVNGKTGWAFEKVNGLMQRVSGYAHNGLEYAARPIILAGGLIETVKVTAGSVRRQVQSVRMSSTPTLGGAHQIERPAEEPESVVPLV